MQLKQLCRAMIGALCLAGVPLASAHADTVLYNESGIIQGQQSFGQAFDITTAGTLTITLSQVPWLQSISGLGASLTTPTGTLGSMGAGTESIQVNPGVIYANWYGDSSGMGIYGINVRFTPGNVAPVPLPAAGALLLSGLCAGAFFLRRRPSSATARALNDDGAMTI